jgi:leucyl/phenylalanyl-tRNA---protein transferase
MDSVRLRRRWRTAGKAPGAGAWWTLAGCTAAECIVAPVPGAIDPDLVDAGVSPPHMVAGYRAGLFPMDAPGATGPVGWFVAEPRAVILPPEARVPRTVARMLRRRGYAVRVDTAFGEVVRACGGDRDGTWLTPRLARAYDALHAIGIAHSVEAWDGDRLVGGLFGVAMGRFMSAESMFHRAPDGGNAALAGLLHIARRSGAELVDVQMESDHVARFGAREIPAAEFTARLAAALRESLAG